MPKKYPKGLNPLRPLQLQFIKRLARGDGTAEELLGQLRISETVFGQWLQKPIFVRRYNRAIQQVQARAISVEATAKLQHARGKLTDTSQAVESQNHSPIKILPDLETPLSQRLLELHGSEGTIAKKIKDANESA